MFVGDDICDMECLNEACKFDANDCADRNYKSLHIRKKKNTKECMLGFVFLIHTNKKSILM